MIVEGPWKIIVCSGILCDQVFKKKKVKNPTNSSKAIERLNMNILLLSYNHLLCIGFGVLYQVGSVLE